VIPRSSLSYVLARLTVSTLFGLIRDQGITQSEIAERVQMAQSEVSEILHGRQVQSYAVLERICLGFDIPRGFMGLAYDGNEPVTESEEVDEEVKRRAMFGVATVALFGSPVLGEILELPRPVEPTPLPTRLRSSDVEALRKLTTGLQELAREYGGCAQMVGEVANRSRVLLSVPARDEITAGMSTALAELHTAAGWCCVDEGLPYQARAYFAQAMDLGDSYQVAWALRHAGVQMVDAGAYNDALKAVQLAMMGTDDPELKACLEIESAVPFAGMRHKTQALEALKRGNEHPQSNIFNAADMDNVISDVYRRLGQLNNAEVFARASLDKWTTFGTDKRDSVEAEITLATVHLRSGEIHSGVLLARQAIADVSPLQSVRAKRRLAPLERALAERKNSTCQDLAQAVRAVRV
jgi:transcriptional regulator with XRE-family HTH domain